METVDFYDKHSERSGSLQIPKKTKVFIEQTIRERENAPGKTTNKTLKCIHKHNEYFFYSNLQQLLD